MQAKLILSIGTIGSFVAGEMFFPLSAGRLAPVYSASLLPWLFFIIIIFLILCFKEQSGIWEKKVLPTTVTLACRAVQNRKMRSPEVASHLNSQNSWNSWLGATLACTNTNAANLKLLVFSYIVPTAILQLLPQHSFFFHFLMFHFPLLPYSLYWLLFPF